MRALVTGILGQDGSYIADLLIEKGYEVFGLVRRTGSDGSARLWRIQHLLPRLRLLDGDLTDQTSIVHALNQAKPDEIYSLGAQSFVRYSFDAPASTSDVTGLGALRLFDAARAVCPGAKIFQASSSEMFGDAPPPQHERTPMDPCSPYGVAKLFAHKMAQVYRKSYGMFIACGISFNHESGRRGSEFVTRKITLGGALIKAGLQQQLSLGNLDSKRDWSYAPEIMEAAWLMLQQDMPDDYVLASGETHTVREFLEKVFAKLELDVEDHVIFDPSHIRPAEVPILCGDASKAKDKLGWSTQTTFDELVDIMVDADCERVLQQVG